MVTSKVPTELLFQTAVFKLLPTLLIMKMVSSLMLNMKALQSTQKLQRADMVTLPQNMPQSQPLHTMPKK